MASPLARDRGQNDNLVYILYGSIDHREEATFSILSALHHLGPDPRGMRIVVYTDDPDAFADLPVHVHRLTADVVGDWSGPFAVGHRRKILGIRDALRRFGGRLLYCDSDTFFTGHPARVFARIGQGRSVMHIGEYRLADPCAYRIAEAVNGVEFRRRTGGPWSIGPKSVMFNAGVIGIDERDISQLDAVVHLCDQIDTVGRRLVSLLPGERLPWLHPEQLAFSICLWHSTRLRQAYDVVAHYWPPAPRALFRDHLIRVVRERTLRLSDEHFRQLWRYAPESTVRPFQWGRQSSVRRLGELTRTWLSQFAGRVGLKQYLSRAVRRGTTDRRTRTF